MLTTETGGDGRRNVPWYLSVSMLNLFESLKQAKPSQNQEAMKVENAQYDKVRGIHDSDIGPRIIFWCQLREFY